MDTKPRTASVARSYEDFKPTTELVPGEAFDTFIIRLPGFRKEHLRVQVDGQGNLRTSGERPLDGRRWSRFVVVFKLPENCSLSDVRAKFENETLLVRFPKLIAPEPVVPIKVREEEKKLQAPKEEKDVPAKSNGDKEMVPRTETRKVKEKEKEKEEAAKSNGEKKIVPRTETEKVKEKEKEEAAKSNGEKKMVPRTETGKVKEKEKDEAAKSNGDKEMVPRTETGKVKEKKEEKDEAAKSNGDKKMVPRTEIEKVKEKKEEKDEAAKSDGDKKMVARTETEKAKKEKEETSSKEKVEDKKLNGEKTMMPREEPEKEKEEVKDDKEKVEYGGGGRAEQPAWQEFGGIIMELSQAGKTRIWKLAAAMLVLLVLVLYLKHQSTQG